MKWKKEIIGNMTIKEIAQLAQVSSAAEIGRASCRERV